MTAKIEGIGEEDLRRMYETEQLSQQDIAEFYDVSRTTIWRKMKEYEINRRYLSGHVKLAEKGIVLSKDILQSMYEHKRWSLRKIADYFDVSDIFIRRRMKEFNIPTRKMDAFSDNSAIHRIYNINEDFFETWNDKSAYLFGWALGDGYIKDERLRFHLQKGDEEILYMFRDVMGSNHPITNTTHYNKQYNKQCYGSVVEFSSVRLIKGLKKLSYLDVPNEIFSHFLRGFWEAEGSVFWHKEKTNKKGGNLATSLSQNDNHILGYILSQLRGNGLKGGFLSLHRNNWKLSFSVNESLSLYRFIYDKCNDMFLKRKKERFEELIRKQLA